MTTAIRTTDVTALVAADHVHDLIQKQARLERDLTSARVRNATLTRELRRAIEAPAIVGQSVVDKMLTLTYSNGRIVQLQPFSYHDEHSTEYGQRWVEIAPAPDTAKAIVDAALAPADAEDDEQHYDTTFRALAGLALHGMSVSSGDER